MVARQFRVLEAWSSNLHTSTIKGLQKRYSHRKTLILSGFFLFLWVKFYFSVCTYKKDIFLNTDSNSHMFYNIYVNLMINKGTASAVPL